MPSYLRITYSMLMKADMNTAGIKYGTYNHVEQVYMQSVILHATDMRNFYFNRRHPGTNLGLGRLGSCLGRQT